MDVGVGDVDSEPDRKKTVSGDGGDGPSHTALPSYLEAAYNEIDESYEEAAEYAMWGGARLRRADCRADGGTSRVPSGSTCSNLLFFPS